MDQQLDENLLEQIQKASKALALLRDSFSKYQPFDLYKIYSPSDLESYDALALRFEKVVELFINQLFRSLEIHYFGLASSTIRDRLLALQKVEFIDDINTWMDMRIIRNKIAHDYLPDQIKRIYEDILIYSKIIFETFQKIEQKFLMRLP